MSRVLKVSNGNYRIQVGAGGKILLDTNGTGSVSILGTADSTSITSGALQVAGGAGIAGNVFMGKVLSLTVSTAEPSNPYIGMFAVADRILWNPASKVPTDPYPVFYNGSVWTALY